jgi:hypothetical protein
MAWLPDWHRRVKVTVDSTKIKFDLDYFPIPIIICSGIAGQDDDNLSCIFDELGDYSQRIAVTQSDGTTQLYVEIESWDSSTNNAVLWTSCSGFTLASGTDTYLYLYYEDGQGNNTDYVGTSSNRPEVWNSNIVARYGMAEDPSGGEDCILDSTSNANHGTPAFMGSSNLVDTDVGKAIVFNGDDEEIDIGSDSSLYPSSAIAISAYKYFDETNNSESYPHIVGANSEIQLWDNNGMDGRINGGYQRSASTVDNGWQFICYGVDADSSQMWTDGTLQDSGGGGSLGYSATTTKIGSNTPLGSRYFCGKIAEVRFYSIIPLESWQNAEYSARIDDFLTFGEEELSGQEVILIYYFSGHVYEENDSNPVSRTIRLYNRDTGLLLGSTTSSGDGYYYIETTYSGSHYILALDDDEGTQYNLAVLDRMMPAVSSGILE